MVGNEAIVLEGASKRFGTHTALHPTDLVISRGQAALLAVSYTHLTLPTKA